MQSESKPTLLRVKCSCGAISHNGEFFLNRMCELAEYLQTISNKKITLSTYTRSYVKCLCDGPAGVPCDGPAGVPCDPTGSPSGTCEPKGSPCTIEFKLDEKGDDTFIRMRVFANGTELLVDEDWRWANNCEKKLKSLLVLLEKTTKQSLILNEKKCRLPEYCKSEPPSNSLDWNNPEKECKLKEEIKNKILEYVRKNKESNSNIYTCTWDLENIGYAKVEKNGEFFKVYRDLYESKEERERLVTDRWCSLENAVDIVYGLVSLKRKKPSWDDVALYEKEFTKMMYRSPKKIELLRSVHGIYYEANFTFRDGKVEESKFFPLKLYGNYLDFEFDCSVMHPWDVITLAQDVSFKKISINLYVFKIMQILSLCDGGMLKPNTFFFYTKTRVPLKPEQYYLDNMESNLFNNYFRSMQRLARNNNKSITIQVELRMSDDEFNCSVAFLKLQNKKIKYESFEREHVKLRKFEIDSSSKPDSLDNQSVRCVNGQYVPW